MIQLNKPFKFHPSCEDPETYVAIRITPCSAMVRCISRKEHFEFESGGQLISFDRPGKPFPIAVNSQVFYEEKANAL